MSDAMKALHEHLLDMLGKPVNRELIDALAQELGSPDEDSFPTQFVFSEAGLSITTDSARFYELVFCMSSEYPEFGWRKAFPFGIEPTDRAEEVEKKLLDKRLVRKELSPDHYGLVYRIYPYELMISFDGDCEQLGLLAVRYVGIFTDTSTLSQSFILQLMNGEEMNLFESGIEIPEFNDVLVTTTDESQHAIELAVFHGVEGSAEKGGRYSNYIVHQLQQSTTGIANVEVRFEVLIDGNLKVTAIDLCTKKKCAVAEKIVY